MGWPWRRSDSLVSLVGGFNPYPSEKRWFVSSSVGVTTFPTVSGKIKHVPNHQPVVQGMSLDVTEWHSSKWQLWHVMCDIFLCCDNVATPFCCSDLLLCSESKKLQLQVWLRHNRIGKWITFPARCIYIYTIVAVWKNIIKYWLYDISQLHYICLIFIHYSSCMKKYQTRSPRFLEFGTWCSHFRCGEFTNWIQVIVRKRLPGILNMFYWYHLVMTNSSPWKDPPCYK